MTTIDKRIASFLLLASSMSFVIVGCGGENPNGEGTTDTESAAVSDQAAEVADVADPAAITPAVAGACRDGHLCFYRNAYFLPSSATEGHGELTDSAGDLRAFKHAGCKSRTWDQCISSLRNYTRFCWHLHSNIAPPFRRDDLHKLSAGDQYSDLQDIHFDDKIRSLEKIPSQGKCL
jgi:hypothetical protein